MTVVIGALARKGGCGKSTALKLMASAMTHSGRTVTIIDTDPQGDMTRWWARTQEHKNTSPLVDFHIAPTNDEALYDLIDERDGKSDFILIDTKGEGSDWSQTIAAVSDFIITPVMISPTDHALTLDIRDWFADLMDRVEPGSTVAKQYFLLSRVPASLTKTGELVRERIVRDLPLLDVEVKERKLLLDQDEYGLISPMWSRLLESENPLERGQAANFETLIKLGYQITKALLNGTQMPKDRYSKTPEKLPKQTEKQTAPRKKRRKIMSATKAGDEA